MARQAEEELKITLCQLLSSEQPSGNLESALPVCLRLVPVCIEKNE